MLRKSVFISVMKLNNRMWISAGNWVHWRTFIWHNALGFYSVNSFKKKQTKTCRLLKIQNNCVQLLSTIRENSSLRRFSSWEWWIQYGENSTYISSLHHSPIINIKDTIRGWTFEKHPNEETLVSSLRWNFFLLFVIKSVRFAQFYLEDERTT